VWAGFILVLIQGGGGLFWTWRVLWFQKMQGTSWAAEDILVSQERLIHGVDYSVIWCCVWGWIKRVYKSCYLRCQTCRNFNCHWYIWQRVLVFMLMWYEAYAQKEHSYGSPTLQHTWKIGLTLKFERSYVFVGHEKYTYLLSVDSLGNCMAVMWCQATCCQMVPHVASRRDNMFDDSPIGWQKLFTVK
jgi:hypothetical protein